MSDSTIEDVLERKGTVQIIVEIGYKDQTFDQIAENVLVSSSTVSNRLKEGVKVDLFEIVHRPTDHGTQKRYELTENGEVILEIIHELDIEPTVKKYQRISRRFDQQRNNLIHNVKRHLPVQLRQAPSEIGEDEDYSDRSASEELKEFANRDLSQMRRERLDNDIVGGINEIESDSEDDERQAENESDT